MMSIWKTYTWAGAACLAIAVALAGNGFAQQQEQQDQPSQSQQQSSDEQAGQQQEQQEQQPSQTEEQAAQSQQQRDEQQPQREEQERQRQQQQQEQQRQRQDYEQQSREREEAWRGESQAWREREQWPGPDRERYGSDSLRYRTREESRERELQRTPERQGGLGVQVFDDGRGGVVVGQVTPGSPADNMGIRERDRIIAVNGREIQSVNHFIARIRNMEPGQQVELDIRRAAGDGQQTVRGELESRQEALAERGPVREEYWIEVYPEQGRESRQTSYDEDRMQYGPSQRGGQMSSDRLDQIERQVSRLSRELDDLRVALQNIRRQSGERTARYDEFEGRMQGRPSDARWDSERGEYRQAERGEYDRGEQRTRDRRLFDREGGRRPLRDRFDEGPGGEIGSDRQNVGTENLERE